jgi:quercetin dioxygenase-like cupin family protein
MFNGAMKGNEMISSLQTKPYMLHSDDAQRLQSLGALVSILAATEQTGGAFNLFNVSCPVGFATPLHIHYAEDVVIFVLEGTLTFFLGEKRMEARTGSYFFQPKGTPHGFRAKGDDPARILYLAFPAGLDQFVIEHASQSKRDGVVTTAARHKIEILGNLPD